MPIVEELTANRLNYESYLKVPELLSMQQVLSAHHDEMLFILIHQIYELWFKELIHEVQELIRCFDADDVKRGIKVMQRINTITEVLIKQIDVLETMTPTEFAEFRDHLRPASGFQSAQFRELEFLCGLKNPKFLAMFTNMPHALEKLQARFDAPSLYDHFIRLLARSGYTIPETLIERDYRQPHASEEAVSEALEDVYKNPKDHYEIYLLCEAMVTFDEHMNLWRYRHVKMVERTIGMKAGTGGSSGAQYLASTLSGKLFPDLWDVRTRIGTY